MRADVCTAVRLGAMLKIAIASFAMAFSFAARASAGDYAVAYAVELHEDTITGRFENCVYGQVCQKQIESTGLIMGIIIKGAFDGNGSLSLTGRGGCCFFFDGSRSTRVGASSSVAVPIFEGKQRLRNELVLNHAVGSLHIAISKN